MTWDFSTEPEFEAKLEWMRDFVKREIFPLEVLETDDGTFTRVVRSLCSVRSNRSRVGGRTRVNVSVLPCLLTAAITRCHSPSVSRARGSSTGETGTATTCKGRVKSSSAFCCAPETERTRLRRPASSLCRGERTRLPGETREEGHTGVSGDLKLYQYRRFENGRFSSWHP